jgi:hypothetical protein
MEVVEIKSSRPRVGLEEHLSLVDRAVNFWLGFNMGQSFNHGLVSIGWDGHPHSSMISIRQNYTADLYFLFF